MTASEGPAGLKTAVLRKPTQEEITATDDQVLIPEESYVNRVGKHGFQ